MNRFNILSTCRTADVVLGGCFLCVAMAASAQPGITSGTGLDKSGNPARERSWCLANTQDTALFDCLKESSNAAAEKRRGTLDNNGANYRANAVERCNVFESVERVACEARVSGYGSSSGSVKDGGVIRGIRTTVLPAGTTTVVIPGAQR